MLASAEAKGDAARQSADAETLFGAVMRGDAEGLQALIAGGAELEAKDEHGFTAFLLACSMGQVECMAMLIEAGCDAVATDASGTTGLMEAAAGGHAATVRSLIAGSAELEAKDEDGNTAFLHACSKGRVECVDMSVLSILVNCARVLCTCAGRP